jgi:hypothetical protein
MLDKNRSVRLTCAVTIVSFAFLITEVLTQGSPNRRSNPKPSVFKRAAVGLAIPRPRMSLCSIGMVSGLSECRTVIRSTGTRGGQHSDPVNGFGPTPAIMVMDACACNFE